MRYIFPILVFLILAVQPSVSCCFYSPVRPYFLYLYDGTEAGLSVFSPPTTYPNPHAWDKKA